MRAILVPDRACFAIAMLAWLAVLLAPGVTAVSAQACQLIQLADLPARVVDNNVLVKVALDGKTADMTLDIIPTNSYLLTSAAERLGIPTYGNEGYDRVSHIRRLTIGDVPFPNIDLDTRDIKPADFRPEYQGLFDAGWSGTIGPPLLSSFDVEFDLANNHVVLFAHNACAGKIQYWAGPLMAMPFERDQIKVFSNVQVYDDHAIRLPVTINGHEGFAVLSSTDPVQMQWSVANRFGISRQAPGLQQMDAGPASWAQHHPSYRYTLDTLTVGPETLHHVPAVINSVTDTGGDNDRLMTLGTNFLVTNRVYIAYADHMVYFTPFSLIPKAGH